MARNRQVGKDCHFPLLPQSLFSRLFHCMSIKLGISVKGSIFVITDKFIRICLNIHVDTVVQNLKSERKPQKVSRLEKLVDLFLVFPARLET